MGCTQSVEDPEAKRRNAEIEEQIKRDRVEQSREVKMLLLGAGESGKSTILKQMRLIYNKPYSNEEREDYREIVFSNTVQSMKVLLEGMEEKGVTLSKEAKMSDVDLIKEHPGVVEGHLFPAKVANAVRALWMDPGVREMFARRSEIQLNDSAAYFFDAAYRTSRSGYLPTDMDILRARVKTTGITETQFEIGGLKYKLFDVGGQRSERRKWLGIFESVTALVFLIAISEYDQMLYEDTSVNRMEEAMTLFESVANSKWFINSSIMLFLNKIDLFRLKIENSAPPPNEKGFTPGPNKSGYSPLSDTFPEYTGGNDYDKACKFLLDKFCELNGNPNKSLYTHFTDATDTKALAFVVSAVHDVIIHNNLKNCGLL